jgi:hypothetical protein
MQQAPFRKVAKLLSSTPSTTTSGRKANFTISVIGVNKTYRIFQEKSGLWELPCKRKCSSTLYSMFSIS